MTFRSVHDSSPAGGRRRAALRSKVAVLRIVVLVVIVVGLFVLGEVRGLPDVRGLRAQVDAAGQVGWLVFVGGYAVLALVPAPKGAMTALGGLLFGWVAGAGLSLAGALIGALVAFDVGRWLGRDVVDRMLGGRLSRVDSVLEHHGLVAVLAVRLVPVLPYTVINYASGLTGVRRRDYLLGSAVGMVPGSLAYAALGAWGTDPLGLFAGISVLLLLVLVGGVWGRRLLDAQPRSAGDSPTAPEQDQPGDGDG